jgi:hypothetical protein
MDLINSLQKSYIDKIIPAFYSYCTLKGFIVSKEIDLPASLQE